MIELKNHPNSYSLPCTFYVKPAFPTIIMHDGKEFWKTGKYGVTKDIPSAEYANETDERVWLDANNNISLD